MQKLKVGSILSNAVAIGARNALPLVGAVFLWLITFWIPYINVGTSIGLIGIVAKMGRGGTITPTEIFDSRYRKQMGEFFLVTIFISMGTSIGHLFFVIPGVAIAFAWLLSPLLVLDRGVSPMQALQDSNDRMEGNKLPAFFALALIQVGGGVLIGILLLLMSNSGSGLSLLFGLAMLAVGLITITAALGVVGYLYSALVEGQASVAEAQESSGVAGMDPAV